jgi:hypothetical protein
MGFDLQTLELTDIERVTEMRRPGGNATGVQSR